VPWLKEAFAFSCLLDAEAETLCSDGVEGTWLALQKMVPVMEQFVISDVPTGTLELAMPFNAEVALAALEQAGCIGPQPVVGAEADNVLTDLKMFSFNLCASI
jgi:hypothetical protein